MLTFAVTPADEQQAAIDMLAIPVKALANTPQIADAMEQGVSTFMEAVPALIKALDEVAKVHPFISSARCLIRPRVILPMVPQLLCSRSRLSTRSRSNAGATIRG